MRRSREAAGEGAIQAMRAIHSGKFTIRKYLHGNHSMKRRSAARLGVSPYLRSACAAENRAASA